LTAVSCRDGFRINHPFSPLFWPEKTLTDEDVVMIDEDDELEVDATRVVGAVVVGSVELGLGFTVVVPTWKAAQTRFRHSSCPNALPCGRQTHHLGHENGLAAFRRCSSRRR
jgi:hypothetical protein